MKSHHGRPGNVLSLRHVTPEHFRERARSYRYAAALADDRQDVRRFRELASMFEEMAVELCDRRRTGFEKLAAVPAASGSGR